MRTKRQPAGSAVSAFRRLPIALAVAGAMSQAAMGAVITVTNNAAAGPGSFADAITQANLACELGDTAPVIQFSGPFTISQSIPLPSFSCTNPSGYSPRVDGFTNTGATANTDPSGWNASLTVAIDGSSNFSGPVCVINKQNFAGYGGTLTVQGLEVRNFTYGGNETGICGRVKVTGSIVRNNRYGIFAESGSAIGGTASQERNLVTGNPFIGIEFDGAISIVNNIVGVDFDGTTPYASPPNDGIAWCGCNTPSGSISGNTVVANSTGIGTGGSVNIIGNRIGTDPTGAQILGGSGSFGIYLGSNSGTNVIDNVIAGWAYGVNIDGGGNNYLRGNKVGTNGAGDQALGNFTGIKDAFSYGTRMEGNLVSGNGAYGIHLQGTTDGVILGNTIGTNGAGSAALGNSTGIYIGVVAANNIIDGNLISGNETGIYSSDASDTTFINNRIGLSASGTPLPNGYGFWAECGTNLRVEGNVISGNTYNGLEMYAIQSSMVLNNSIGASGANGGHGIYMTYSSCGGGVALKSGTAAKSAVKAGRLVQSPKSLGFGMFESDLNQLTGNVINNNGGKGVFIEGGNNNQLFQNSISSNAIDGVRIDSHYGTDAYGGTIVVSAAIGNAIVENTIAGNGNKNINLAFDGGVLPNDPGDADTGKPNNWQNHPAINPSGTFYDPINNWTTIGFGLDSKAGQYRIDFFSNPMPGPPAGATYLGNTFITLPADGASFGSYTVNGMHDNISATATRVGPEIAVVRDTSEFSPQNVTSILPVPGVNVVPTSINFGDVVVGRSSGASAVTVTSTGTAPYVVNSLREGSCSGPAICTSGSFSCSTTCSDGSSWNAGTSCTITASFNPTAVGAQSKTLALCDNAVGSPRTISFTGNGIDPPTVDISYSPSSWSFGEVLVGAQSSIKTFTLANAGTNTVYLGAATASGDFLVTGGSCSATLAGGASCTTDVAYAPTARGGVNGSLQITGSNTAPAPAAAARRAKVTTPTTATAVAQLQGSGLQSGELRLPASVAFGTIVLHSDTRQQNVELRNTGNGPLAISSITVAGPFTMTNDCGPTLATGASCTVVVKFNPANLGTANGTLTIVSDAPGGSRAIALTAQVIADARPVVRVTPTQAGFGNRQIGTESNPQPVTITNEGAQTANLGPMVVTQPENGGGGTAKSEFIISGTTCATTLAPQASCVANIVFRALGFGERKGELSVSSNSADSPQKATLSGTGCRPYAAGVNRSGRDPCAP